MTFPRKRFFVAVVASLLGLTSCGGDYLDSLKKESALAPDPFPDRLSAYVWRNWHLVPVERMARVVKEFLPIVRGDSRIGFEASNHYYYLPIDIVEKVLLCRQIIEDLVSRDAPGCG